MYRVKPQLEGYAFALPTVAFARHGVRHGSVPQLVLLPQERQRNHEQGRGDGQLQAADRVAAERKAPEELVPRVVQHGAYQLYRGRAPYAALRGRHGKLLHRPVGRGYALQRTGGKVLEREHGQHPRQAFHGNLGERTGAEGTADGTQMPEELLDGGHGKPRYAQVHQVSCEVGVAEQAALHAGQAGLHRPEMVRRRPRPVPGGFKGEVLSYLTLLPVMRSHKAERQEHTRILANNIVSLKLPCGFPIY